MKQTPTPWRNRLGKRSLLNYLLFPFSILFAGIARFRRFLYHRFPPAPLPGQAKVVIIGNLSAGGSGKTPFTLFLAEFLQNHGIHPAVCLRGYRGSYEHTNKLISDRNGLLPGADQAGDEALLLAKSLLGIPVVVGANRRESIRLLNAAFPDLSAILLDDGFQHLKIPSQLRFVVFNTQAGIGNGFVLPAGLLREPLSALRDAHALVFNGQNDDVLQEKLNYLGPILQGSMQFEEFRSLEGQPIATPSTGTPALLLSGIGFPGGFEDSMRATGLRIVGHLTMPDHYQFADGALWTELETRYRAREFAAVVVTTKDAMKLKPQKELPIWVAVSRFEPAPESVPELKLLLQQHDIL